MKGTKRYRRHFAATIAALGVTAGFAASANAITLTNFDTGNVESQPLGIVALPSGSLQFADPGVNALGTISSGGVVSLNVYNNAQGPAQIALDSAGNPWVTEGGGALTGGFVTKFSGGVAARIPVALTALNLQGIASVGTSLWFVSQDADNLYSVTNSGTVGGPFSTAQGGSPGPPIVPPTAGTSPKGITKGPGSDTNVYIATSSGVSMASTTGPPAPNQIAGIPDARAITVGPDGNLWVGHAGGVAHINTAGGSLGGGASIPGSNVNAITTGADGALWFTESALDKVGRVTTAGAFTDFALPGCHVPSGIAKGADNLLYVTCFGAEITPGGPTTGHTIVRISPDATTPGPGPGPGPGPVTPTVANLKGGFSFAKGKVFAGKAFTVNVSFNKAVTKSRVRVQIKSVNTKAKGAIKAFKTISSKLVTGKKAALSVKIAKPGKFLMRITFVNGTKTVNAKAVKVTVKRKH